jgi:hypothetical protein
MFVKTLERDITETHLLCEYFGNVVAREANLMTPEPALVAIDADAAQMINESSAARAAGKSVPPGIAVGSELIRPAVHPARTSNLSPEQLREAAAIYVYDMLAHHADRRVTNPNLLIVRGHFVTIDFDMVFPFLWPLAPDIEPWEVSKLRFPEAHTSRKFCAPPGRSIGTAFSNRPSPSISSGFAAHMRRCRRRGMRTPIAYCRTSAR